MGLVVRMINALGADFTADFLRGCADEIAANKGRLEAARERGQKRAQA